MLMDSRYRRGEVRDTNFKPMGREATDVQLTDMLTSINAGGRARQAEGVGLGPGVYTLMAPIVQAGVDADAFAALSADGKSDLSVET